MMQSETAEKQKTISIKRKFNLPLKSLWRAFTESESLKKWWGPKAYTCPDCTIDFRVGGKFLASMEGADGQKIWSTGTYKEIIHFKKIINTDSFSDSDGNIVPASHYNIDGEWGSDAQVALEFEEVDGKTNLSLQHTGVPVELSDECLQGWQSSFDKLEANVR
jgi:uncharacterized protein YndB with AHSA1/START domain